LLLPFEKENQGNGDGSQYKTLMSEIESLHYARSESDLHNMHDEIQRRWREQALETFVDYIQTNMSSGPFSEWQCYHCPTGYAKTNNPIENFNGDFKATYSQRTRFPVIQAIGLTPVS
jgi:hypothetical protein